MIICLPLVPYFLSEQKCAAKIMMWGTTGVIIISFRLSKTCRNFYRALRNAYVLLYNDSYYNAFSFSCFENWPSFFISFSKHLTINCDLAYIIVLVTHDMTKHARSLSAVAHNISVTSSITIVLFQSSPVALSAQYI